MLEYFRSIHVQTVWGLTKKRIARLAAIVHIPTKKVSWWEQSQMRRMIPRVRETMPTWR